MIMWHLVRGHSEIKAIAAASECEPALGNEDMLTALEWARRGIAFANALSVCPPDTDVCELARKCGLPHLPDEDVKRGDRISCIVYPKGAKTLPESVAIHIRPRGGDVH